jgi:4-hydroxybenzoyl-CoA reductase subunit beta
MLRLPRFSYRSPRTLREAADLLAAAEGDAMLVAGGTDVIPNMKRRQRVPTVLVGLRQVQELQHVVNADGLTVGAGVTLAELVRARTIREHHGGLAQAAAQIATPLLRNMGTLGGNLCLDTRCNYYDQTYEWRKAVDFCLKKDGDICWVAPSSARCLAVSSTDIAPMLIALGASATLVDAQGERTIPVAELYRNDGMDYLTRRPAEILSAVHLPANAGWRSAYWKLRRRGSFDFSALSVAAAVKLGRDGVVEAARVVLGAVASRPVENPAAALALIGQPLSDAAIHAAAELAAQPARPMDNTDFPLVWRKRVTRDFVGYALKEIRGDEVRDLRRKIARLETLGLAG